jgi:2-dehydropantoate 2-reductase
MLPFGNPLERPDMPNSNAPIVILGAGAIGCYVGAIWADAGCNVTLLGRPNLQNLQQTGLSLSNGVSIPAQSFASNPIPTHDANMLQTAGLIVLSVKATALPAAIAEITAHAKPDTPILCLLNGLKPIRDLRAAFPNRNIAAGMVPYNVIWANASTLNRSSVGDIIAERTPMTEALKTQLALAKEPLQLSDDINAVQHGKLLLNLNNPVNALSGETLYAQLRQRPYRRAYAAILAEAISVFDQAGIAHAQSGPLPAAKIVKLLRFPNWAFNILVLPRQKLDPTAQTSMAQDLSAGKLTEIDTLNGEICHIANTAGVPAPINAKIVDLVKAAQSGGQKSFSGAELCAALGV